MKWIIMCQSVAGEWIWTGCMHATSNSIVLINYTILWNLWNILDSCVYY